MGNYDYTTVSTEIKHVTEAAVLIHSGDATNQWIPLSLIDPSDLSRLKVSKKCIEIGVAEWFDMKEGLI